MGKPEAVVEDYLIERVKVLGGQQRKLKWVGRDGAPDRLVWFEFPAVGVIEVKRDRTVGPRGVLRAAQVREINGMRAAGWPVYIVESRYDVDEALRAIMCCIPVSDVL